MNTDSCFLGKICGDKCTNYDGDYVCECGGTTFDKYYGLYCCIQKNDTCTGMLTC